MSRPWPRTLAVLTDLRRLALVAVLLAMALGLGNRERPAAQRIPELDVLIAVDRTTSMSALDDPSGSRITAVRRDLLDLRERLPLARFAVVTFGQSAELRLPFTSDPEAYGDTVRRLQVELAAAGTGSAVGLGAPLMAELLDRAASERLDRIPVVVLVTDGESTEPAPQPSFAEVGGRTTAGVVLGYGTRRGGVMPLERVDVDEQPPTPEQVGAVVPAKTGEPARSRLDQRTLRRIAGQLDVPYVHRDGSQDMAAVAAALTADAYADLPPSESEREIRWLWALLLLGLVLPELRAGWRHFLEARRAGRP